MSHGGESERWREETGERRVFLSTMPPTREERRFALAAVRPQEGACFYFSLPKAAGPAAP